MLRRTSSSSMSSASDPNSSNNHHHHRSPSNASSTTNSIPQPVLVYHASARNIVFRDQLRRAAVATTNKTTRENSSNKNEMSMASSSSATPARMDAEQYSHDNSTTTITADSTASTGSAVVVPKIVPLQPLELTSNDEFEELLHGTDTRNNLSPAEAEVCVLLHDQKCVVKTIKNADWTTFLYRFVQPPPATSSISTNKRNPHHIDLPAQPPDLDYTSFVTSTTLLPSDGLRMRCFGSTRQYTVGVIFALPNHQPAGCGGDGGTTTITNDPDDDAAARASDTWAWPAGYAAKTEFNIDGRGNLINGRAEALVSLSTLRQYNDEYLHSDTYIVAQRRVSGLNQIPYNEVFLRVGGLGRLVQGIDVQTKRSGRQRSYQHGVGLPIALFVRSATYGHLLSLLRTRARWMHTVSETAFRNIPLLYISPDQGVRVLTEQMQRNLWKRAANNLTPFQNPSIAHRTTMESTDEVSFQQKVEELFEIDESIREQLTPEEIGSLAGGFGITDASVATVLQDAMLQDKKWNRDHQGSDDTESHRLQDVVNEGLAAAVRSNDFHTSRQLLLLYSLVASTAEDDSNIVEEYDEPFSAENSSSSCTDFGREGSTRSQLKLEVCVDEDKMAKELERIMKNDGTLSDQLRAPPPPPPLDTDRLRSATNSDGLLAVLGAAQVLKAMRNDTAKRRVEEAVTAIDEWVGYGEQSLAFRVASWYDQRAAQGDLKIATDNDTKLMAFVSNKAVHNRKKFARQLREAVDKTDFRDVRFLLALIEILKEMHSPCLRLELLQYVLGLDNRYSVAHVIRSVELAASCLGIAASAWHMITEEND